MPEFNPSRARSFAALLSRPRGCGTEEERRAAGQVREAFRDAGLETTEEFFHFRPSGDRCVRLVLLAALAALGAVWAGAVWNPWIAVAGIGALGILAFAGPDWATAYLMQRARAAREGEAPAQGWVGASNVVGRAPGPPGSPLLVFVAHFDSKSQNMPIVARVACFAMLGLAGIVGTELAVLRVWLAWPEPGVLHAVFALAAAAAVPLLVLRTGNDSPGALDNACGVGTLVELARIWRDHPLSSRARAIFLSPSAEEHGLIGSRLWVARHLGELKPEPRLHVLNLDGCAARGQLLVLPSGSAAAGALVASARATGLPVRSIPLGIGLIADHVPFVEAGLSCATLMAHGHGTGRIHTSGDSADLLDDAGFEAAGRTLIGAIELLAR